MTAPHCDELVCHAPGECIICDRYAHEEQVRRIMSNICFTGEVLIEGFIPDPASQRRPIEIINKWPGNTPKKTEEEIGRYF